MPSIADEWEIGRDDWLKTAFCLFRPQGGDVRRGRTQGVMPRRFPTEGGPEAQYQTRILGRPGVVKCDY